MHQTTTRKRAQDWARFALKCGVLLTDAKLWSMINNHLKDRANDLGDVVKERYDDASSRMSAATDAFRRRNRPSRLLYFCAGIGVGAGLGLLFAPASGQETRETLRDKAVDVKNKVGDAATSAKTRFRASTGGISPTGTEGY